jgi:DNA-binding transcriptional LysR family regulator
MRSGRFLEFTETGRELVNKARRVLGLMEDMESTLRAVGELRSGHLSIGLSCHHYVMGILAAFMERYPGIQVKARIGDSMDLVDQIFSCSIDIAGVTAIQPDSRLFSRLFSRQRIILFAGRNHPWATELKLGAERLHKQRMVTWHATSITRTIFMERLSALGIRPRIVLELDSWETIREAVAAGLGFGIALEDEFAPDSRICRIDLTGVDLSAMQYFVCMPEFRSLKPVEAFFQLAEEIGLGHPGSLRLN